MSDKEAGYSQCCNDVVEILANAPADATKDYITHYLLSELCNKFYEFYDSPESSE